MSKEEKIILLNQYKENLNYLKKFELKEEVKIKEKPKVLVLTKRYNGKNFKVA